MSLIKPIVSERTGATNGFHVVQQVVFITGRVNVVVESYPDAASYAAKKMASDLNSETFPYNGAPLTKAPIEYGDDLLLTLDKYKGAAQG